MVKNIVNQRFIDCVNFLIKTKKVPSKSFLAEKFSISNSKFSEILNKRMNVGIDLLIVLASDFNISSDWLLLGKGEMLKTNIVEDSNNDCSHYKELAEERAYTIQMQKEIINNLREEIALLKKDTKYPISSKSSL